MEQTFSIIIHDWAEDILQEVAEFTFSIWKEERPNLQLDRFVNWFNTLDLKYPPKVIIASLNGKMIGWIFFVQITASEAEINPWALNGHPIILKEYEDSHAISERLIERAIEYGKEKKLTRVELNFKENEDTNNVDYQTLGLHLIERNCHMRYNLSQNTTHIYQPINYKVIPINKINKDTFFQCFLETFRESEDLWLSDKTDEEMCNYFHEVIVANDFPLIEQASIGIFDDNQLMAFSIVRESHGASNGQLWIMGVHPNYRRKGIGRKIIHHIKLKLLKQGYKSTSLNVNLSNIPALNLYLSESYKQDWVQFSYAWKSEK